MVRKWHWKIKFLKVREFYFVTGKTEIFLKNISDVIPLKAGSSISGQCDCHNVSFLEGKSLNHGKVRLGNLQTDVSGNHVLQKV